MNSPLASIVIVGRPNVGKSTLFNRIVGARDAIVDDQPGVTRDLKYRNTDWSGVPFRLVDTGGYFGPEEDPLSPLVQGQIDFAISDATVILFVLDGQDGPTPIDHTILDILRRTKRPLVACINKVDNTRIIEETTSPFYELGLGEFQAISASHGMGIGDLLDELVSFIPKDQEYAEEEKVPGLAIIGRPNVGKSTLLNALCGSSRSIVSNIAGTTRDPVDTNIEFDGKQYLLIDTAGIRRRGKMSQGLDRYALQRAKQALERCDIALLMIDGIEGLTETDAKVFQIAEESGKAAMILVNKWDAIEKETETAGKFAKKIREDLHFLHYAPIEFISAQTTKRVQRIFKHIDEILEQYNRRISTGELNRIMERIVEGHPPPIHKGRSPRVYYWTQVSTAPPTFVAFVSDTKAIHFSYERFLVNRMYEAFEFKNTPIRLYLRKRQQNPDR